jgi:hypothetical protein
LSNVSSSGEIEEFVDSEGGLLNTKTPYLNMALHPRKTMDQTITMTRTSNDPITRGYRVYYGEGKENKGKVVSEIDYSDAFGFEETEDAPTYDVANKILKKMAVEDPIERDERLKRFGFDRQLDNQLKREKKRGKCRNCFTKRRLAELEKQKMDKMLDEILLSKKSKDKEVVKKTKVDTKNDTPIYKILMRNIEAVKKLADKEGVDIDDLVKRLKQGE